MKLTVIDSQACALTGSLFLCVLTNENAWLTIWINECTQQPPIIKPLDLIELTGSKINLFKSDMILNVDLVSRLSASKWKCLQKAFCSNSRGALKNQCTNTVRCHFDICPYGLKTKP